MPFNAPPNTAAWRHVEARDGFEVTYFRPRGGGHRIEGCTTAVEDGQTWAVTYLIDLDSRWTTRSVRVTSRNAAGTHRTELETDGAGKWRVNGEPAPHIAGCLDVDLESSAMTNALPVHRLDPPAGTRVSTPAAYVRALDLSVERLEQEYTRVEDDGCRYDYVSPAFDFSCRLTYDASGLVLDYPGIATRTA
ncbi:putative glycolipid-binding domain-containing protein [Actinomadura sp. 7K534]|uniref:putative glycolipid-binding domain-containing protein n=1 Tax=Actinomadura sp. 7K534 TaxID=2530366 RepID=UPI0010541135|nr:putative glycolipid-binding domain-containing protein [Actinomadura sp. 7K534]TDB88705.1 hypothetical protein E1266_30825 [Actinomadura sp. 7K534]